MIEHEQNAEQQHPGGDLERGGEALAALAHLKSRSLEALRGRATFQPIHDQDIVPVLPCESCHDGGLRAVGRVRGRGRWQRVHACDTCGMLHLFDLPNAPPANPLHE